jgi:hypothetical protein
LFDFLFSFFVFFRLLTFDSCSMRNISMISRRGSGCA